MGTPNSVAASSSERRRDAISVRRVGDATSHQWAGHDQRERFTIGKMDDQGVVFGVERNTSQRALGRDPCEKLRDDGHNLVSVALLKNWCRFLRRKPRATRVGVLQAIQRPRYRVGNRNLAAGFLVIASRSAVAPAPALPFRNLAAGFFSDCVPERGCFFEVDVPHGHLVAVRLFHVPGSSAPKGDFDDCKTTCDSLSSFNTLECGSPHQPHVERTKDPGTRCPGVGPLDPRSKCPGVVTSFCVIVDK